MQEQANIVYNNLAGFLGWTQPTDPPRFFFLAVWATMGITEQPDAN